MVYQIFNDGIDRRQSLSVTSSYRAKATSNKSRNSTRNKGYSFLSALLPNYLSVGTESQLAALLVVTIKILLCLYDLLSLPIYFVLQRPDKRALEAKQIHARQVDASTWIRVRGHTQRILLNNHKRKQTNKNGCCTSNNRPASVDYMGSTLGEVFAVSIERHWHKSALGYRALVSCPMLTLSEQGEHVMQEKSFRSDYTWYTFGQIGQRVQDIASGLYANGVFPQSRALFLASSSLEWFCTAQACFQLAIHMVLAPEISDCNILKRILDEAHCGCIFVSCDKLRQLCSMIDTLEHAKGCRESASSACHCFTLSRIIIIDWPFGVDFNERAFSQLGETLHDLQAGSHSVIGVLSMGQIEESGIESPIELRCSLCQTEHTQVESETNLKGDRTSCRPNETYSPKFADEQWTVPQSSSLARSRRKLARHHSADQYLFSSSSSSSGTSASRESGNRRSSFIEPQPSDLAVIRYTCGSLGQLNAIVLTHSQLTRRINDLYLDGMVTAGDVHCTVLQLDNLVEFMIELCVFSHGGSIGYSCNLNTFFYDGKELFERDRSDVQTLEPNFLLVRPYILESLRCTLQNYLQRKLKPLIGFVMRNALYEYKKYWAQRHYSTPIVDRLFCSKLKQLFGHNVEYILCTGTADCSETKDFFAFMLDLPVIELYGPEEAVISLVSVNDIWDYKRKHRPREVTRAVAGYGWRLFQFDQYEDDHEEEDDDDDAQRSAERLERLMPPKNSNNTYRQDSSKNILFTSSVLCPTFGTRAKLEDWEDFRLSDQPFPRGRLVIGGDSVCQGYLRVSNSGLICDTSNNRFYQDSNTINWFRTGDIARAFPNGSFEIISAISDLIKMVDGQFVSLSQIEHILRNSRFVDNVCAICGDDRSFLINLVVPNLRCLALKSPGEANLKQAIGASRSADGDEPSELVDVEFRREVCNDRLLSEFVGQHLGQLLSKSGLSNLTNRFLLVPEIWTPESELVTPAFEPKRMAIQKFYAADIRSIINTMQNKGNSRRLSARRYKLRKSSSPSMLVL